MNVKKNLLRCFEHSYFLMKYKQNPKRLTLIIYPPQMEKRDKKVVFINLTALIFDNNTT